MIKYLLAIGFMCTVQAGAAVAQEESNWDFEGYVAATTSYRDRGLSFSDGDLAAFASLSAYHSSGFYGGVDLALIKDLVGGNEKTEVFFGYSVDAGDYIYDFSVEVDGIHGLTSEYYPEIKASMARDFGLAFIRGGLAFAPEGRWNAPGVDSYYGYLDFDVPIPFAPSLTALTHIGYDVRDSHSNVWDWSVGVSAFLGDSLEISLSYEDSSLDQKVGDGGFVLGAKFYF